MTYPPPDPARASLSELRALAITPLTPTQRMARDMDAGEHLGSLSQGGMFAYWRGPMFSLDDDAAGDKQAAAFVKDFQQALTRSFTSTNFVHELLSREVGVCAARMTWEADAEADALLSRWWGPPGGRTERLLRDALHVARREGRATLRFRVLPGESPTPEAAARRVRLEAVPPEQARVIERPDTLERVGIYAYQVGGQTAAEACFLDERGRTALRVLRAGGAETLSDPLDLGGRLTLLEVTLPPLISPQILQNQMGYNTVCTLALRNTELAGFVERYGIGIEPPYVLEPDPEAPGRMRRKYLPVKVGGGRINLWARTTYDRVDAQGNYLGEEPTPGGGQYGRLEPVSAEPLMAAAELFRRNIYAEAGQIFVLMNADATSSGRSRELAMADFDARREVVRDAARALISEVGETALALMYALAGQPRPGVRVTGQVQERAIPQGADERAADLADLAAGVMSLAEVRARRGLDNSPPETPPT